MRRKNEGESEEAAEFEARVFRLAAPLLSKKPKRSHVSPWTGPCACELMGKGMNFKGTSNNGAVRGVSISHEPRGMIPAATAAQRQP